MRLEVFPAGSWAGAVASRWRDRLAARPSLRTCLPTGDTPRPVYRLIAGTADLTRSELLLVDEFGLPPDHPARCDAMIRRHLLDLLPAPPAAVHALDPQAADLDAECRRHDARAAGLDLTMLGLGANGHVALNEPGSPRDSRTRVVELAPQTVEHAGDYGAGAAPAWGITMGVGTLLESAEIWLLVTGAHKAAILQRVLEGPVGPKAPATFLRGHPGAVVLADEPAAAFLPFAPGRPSG